MEKERILHLVRHGKATCDYLNVNDFDRPLVEKGIQNNSLVAKRFAACFPSPDLIISSPAVRAYSTAVCFALHCNYAFEKIQLESGLYFTNTDSLLSVIYGCPSSVYSLMLVTHNPDVTELANYFVKGILNELPTSGVVSIRFNADDWNNIHGKVMDYIYDYPKKS
jgi:phosphohistidine phosphatase